MKFSKKTKVLLTASHGGHWIQLSRIFNTFSENNTAYVSTIKNKPLELNKSSNYFNVADINANSNKLIILTCVIKSFFILIKIRPNLVISTGALPGLIIVILAKYIFRSKTIWIDSIANSKELSISGKIASRFADITLTQWKELANDKDNIEYIGSVI